MRILSIDLGDKRVGLAISDPLGITAQGLDTFERSNVSDEYQKIQGICENRQIKECVVGMPLLLSGEAGTQARRVSEWIEGLKKVIKCEVKTWDERLTSKEAGKIMISQGLSRKRQRENSDQLSAILILQNYLESIRIDKGADYGMDI
jgi:putative Holliday junction resolvase